MERRRFIGAGMAALAAPKWLIAQQCLPTRDDRYLDGPFYSANAPKRIQLASDIEPGQRIRIQGAVTACDGAPIGGVNLDVWHATDSGCYQHPRDICPDIPGHPEPFRLRGQLATDGEGRFAFETILPGSYLNGSRYRPRHIHIVITRPGTDTRILTQIYFNGDPYIAGDYGADEPGAANRIITLDKTVPSLWSGNWNIVLPSPATIHDWGPFSSIGGFDIYLRRTGNLIHFHLPPTQRNQPVDFKLYDPRGILVTRFLDTRSPIALDISTLRSGSYFAVLSWWTRSGFRRERISVQR